LRRPGEDHFIPSLLLSADFEILIVSSISFLIFETVGAIHATDYMWLLVDGSDAPKIPSGKDKRLVVLHAGNREEGLIDRCDLVFLAKAKDGDYHQEMNGPFYQF
jgi:hypothetical protein